MPLWAAVLFAVSAAAAPQKGWDWRETTTPHFHILHQAPWLPQGLTIGVERIHSRLRMDLGVFSPWMAKERISLYVYQDSQAYLEGEFSPPAWSNGIAVFGQKAVAIPTMKDPAQMMRTIAHETTHLLFVDFFQEKKLTPPSWLNEGLAMVEEAATRDKPETSVWYQHMVGMSAGSWIPLESFFKISPKDLGNNQASVEAWYVQAYSITLFLVKKHSNLQFKSFCSQLRDGKTPTQALWLVYRCRRISDFESQWKAWLADPAHQRRVAALASGQKDAGDQPEGKAASPVPAFGHFSNGRGFKSGFSSSSDGR